MCKFSQIWRHKDDLRIIANESRSCLVLHHSLNNPTLIKAHHNVSPPFMLYNELCSVSEASLQYFLLSMSTWSCWFALVVISNGRSLFSSRRCRNKPYTSFFLSFVHANYGVWYLRVHHLQGPAMGFFRCSLLSCTSLQECERPQRMHFFSTNSDKRHIMTKYWSIHDNWRNPLIPFAVYSGKD